jgi:hypothetical protein
VTNDELRKLYETSNAEINAIHAKYLSGERLTRADCNQLRHATQRIGLIAKELWIAAGKPDDPEFEILRGPIKLSPLPKSMQPIDLTGAMPKGGELN